MKKPYQSNDWLRNEYLRLRKSPAQIAKECAVDRRTIYRYLEKFGLK